MILWHWAVEMADITNNVLGDKLLTFAIYFYLLRNVEVAIFVGDSIEKNIGPFNRV